MSKLFVANWKANPDSQSKAIALAKKIEEAARRARNVEVVIAPPFIYASGVRGQVSSAKIGAQNVFWEDRGPYTGETSISMLKNAGVRYVILGHSERRRYLHETDEMVNKKVRACLAAGLKVILCVGEPFAVRRKGLAAAKNFVRMQLRKALAIATGYKLQAVNLIIIYEPFWTISTSRSLKGRDNADTPENAAEMIRFIKKVVGSKFNVVSSRIRVLYGGSVNGKNAFSFLSRPEIDGALVGGASLRTKEFAKIIQIAERCARKNILVH